MLFSVHYRHMTGAVHVLKAHPTQPPEKIQNTHPQTQTLTHTHKEALGDHQRGCYQIWTECIRGFSKEVFLDWFKASLVGHYCGWKNTGPTDDTFDLDTLVQAATTAKDDEICSLFLFAPLHGPILPCSFSCKYTEHQNLSDLRCHPLWMVCRGQNQAHDVLTHLLTHFYLEHSIGFRFLLEVKC